MALTEGVTDPLVKAKCFYDFITKKVRYSFMPSYFCLDRMAERCAMDRVGDCGIQALLFLSLCEAVGIPARWESGLKTEPKFIAPTIGYDSTLPRSVGGPRIYPTGVPLGSAETSSCIASTSAM